MIDTRDARNLANESEGLSPYAWLVVALCDEVDNLRKELELYKRIAKQYSTVDRLMVEAERKKEDDGSLELEYTEVTKQEYDNCSISTGFVRGHPVDTIYLKLERDGVVDDLIVLRPDEAQAMAWVLNGVLWSNAMIEYAKDDTP